VIGQFGLPHVSEGAADWCGAPVARVAVAAASAPAIPAIGVSDTSNAEAWSSRPKPNIRRTRDLPLFYRRQSQPESLTSHPSPNAAPAQRCVPSRFTVWSLYFSVAPLLEALRSSHE
jgi:hypothetical protein